MSRQQLSPPWDLVTDDVWTQIAGHLDFRDKLNMQQSCRRLHELLANPSTPDTWGDLEFINLKPLLVWQLCSWVQPRLKGIRGICYTHKGDDVQQLHCLRMMWHALVAATEGSAIRLKLSSVPLAPSTALQPPSLMELERRLTSLDVELEHEHHIVGLCCMSSLRHLQLGCIDGIDIQLLDMVANGDHWEFHLSRLRTLQLIRFPLVAFFVPGIAAQVPHLHSLSLAQCIFPGGTLPTEVLQLPSLTRLELLQLPLRVMPDLRKLPALQALLVCGQDGEPRLGVSIEECSSDELFFALRRNPLGAAMGLTEVVLHDIAVQTQEDMEAIERLPHLKLLALDCLVSEEGAFWAATLQRRMRGRCSVELSTEHITVQADGENVVPTAKWPDDDW